MKQQERFLLGNSYRRLDGEYVRFVEIHNQGKPDETMTDEHGFHRYTNDADNMGMIAFHCPYKANPLNTPPLFFEVQL